MGIQNYNELNQSSLDTYLSRLWTPLNFVSGELQAIIIEIFQRILVIIKIIAEWVFKERIKFTEVSVMMEPIMF